MMMKSDKTIAEKIQTLHPQKGKTNKLIAADKYNQVKVAILKALEQQELTHTELAQKVENGLKNRFEGNINWYMETVKLDLEAREIIKRTKQTPPKYRIENKTE